MTPRQFVDKWAASNLGERQGAQSHFHDLCALLGRDPPGDNDSYCFEKGAEKVGGGQGFADVWRKGAFAWEYKGQKANLGAALRQLQAYVLDLQNPPYLVVSDMARIEVHTNWTNTVSRTYAFTLDDLLAPETLNILRQVFDGSESLKPGVSPQELTATVAGRFGDLGRRLQERKGAGGEALHHPRAIAHFLNRLVFCMFAEDAGLLPEKLFTRMVASMQRRPPLESGPWFDELFAAMRAGGRFGVDEIRWFNGGLFDTEPAIALDRSDLKLVEDTAREHDWSQIDPAIFGTLFEEALKATRERPALGAHYTDREKILKIVEPVIIRPLEAEWAQVLEAIRADVAEREAAEAERRAVLEAAGEALKADAAKAKAGEGARRKALTAAERRRDAAIGSARARTDAFIARLADFRVLDPACGSGNILYVALHALKDLERRAQVDAEREAGVPPAAPRVGLQCVRGIEIEDYAAELARVTLWIGDLQWNARNGFGGPAEPILSTLDQIENRDALLNPDGSEADWPACDVIVGNPPFVGGKRLRTSLGDAAVERLFKAFAGRTPAEADLVVYWVEKAWRAIEAEAAERAGLVTTNSVRGGANRRVLDRIADAGALMEAWADEPWTLQGAAVRVSMLGFGRGFVERRLEGAPANTINADLTGGGVDLTKAVRLKENAGVAFMGDTKGGAFDIPGELAREWLRLPLNPNGRPNSDVLKPWRNAMDVTRRPADKWIIDFGWAMSEADAALYEAPFRYVLLNVEPERRSNNREAYRDNWWRHVEARQGMWNALRSKSSSLTTPRVAKHRIFIFNMGLVPDSALIAIARDDDTTFGILHSRLHELWALRMGTWLGVGNDPRYTPSTTFETFPFPECLTPNLPASAYADDPRAQAIAAARPI